MTNEDLQSLAMQAADGDLEATERLISGIHGHLFSFLNLLGVPERDIDDVAQEVTLQMHRSLARYDPSKPFIPWLRSIARHVTSNYWRSNTRRTRMLGGFRDFLDIHAMTYATPNLNKHFKIAELKNCVDKLEEQQSDIVNLRYFHGLSSASIGERLDLNPSTVRKTLVRIRELLKTCLESSLPRTDEGGRVS